MLRGDGPVRRAAVVGDFDGDGPLVVGVGRGAPRAVCLVDVQGDPAVGADAVVAGCLPRRVGEQVAAGLDGAVARHAVNSDGVDLLGALARVVRAELGVDHQRLLLIVVSFPAGQLVESLVCDGLAGLQLDVVGVLVFHGFTSFTSKKRAGRSPPSPLFDGQALSVELLDDCLDRVDDAFLVDLEALLLQEVEDVLLLLLAAALSDVELLSGGGSTVYGWVNAADISTGSTGTATSYRVRTTADVLNIRKGPGTNYGVAGQIKGKGIYTIVAEAAGPGATKWGKLKSGAGWISLTTSRNSKTA